MSLTAHCTMLVADALALFVPFDHGCSTEDIVNMLMRTISTARVQPTQRTWRYLCRSLVEGYIKLARNQWTSSNTIMSATQPAPRRSRTETFKGFFSKFKGNGRKPATAGRPRAFSISRPHPARVQPEEIEAETRSEAGSLATLDDHSGDMIVSAKGHPRDTKDPGYWGPTRNIPESDLVNLVKRQLRDEWNGEVKELDFQLKRSVSGGFNTAYILESAMVGTICIRVPASGWPYRWNEIDADLTRASALGMKYVFEKSRLPVPELLAFDVSLDNEIRAPYVMMSCKEQSM